MNTLLEILKFTIPSAIMLAAVYIIMNHFLKQEKSRMDHEMSGLKGKEVLALRLQAYERIILVLERMSPNQLLIRLNLSGLNVMQMQALMIQNIRDEFDHNLSQQLYVSSKAWELVRNAKEETIRIINTAGSQLNPDADPNELTGKILELYWSQKEDPMTRALEFIKQEARSLF